MKLVRTEDLQVGDTINVWWSPGWDTIIALRPYTGPLLRLLGEGTQLADFELNKSGMTLEAGFQYERLNDR